MTWFAAFYAFAAGATIVWFANDAHRKDWVLWGVAVIIGVAWPVWVIAGAVFHTRLWYRNRWHLRPSRRYVAMLAKRADLRHVRVFGGEHWQVVLFAEPKDKL